MRVLYLGSPDFAIKPLEAILSSHHEVIGVVTQPDKPVGRKMVITPCPLKEYALYKGLNVYSFNKIRLEGVEKVKELNPDIMVTCAFGQILSKEIIDIPKFGIKNIHASLLPKYRGAAPIQWSIINGDSETGVTIMNTDVGIDTGDIIAQEKIQIGPNENAEELFDRLSILGASMIVKALDSIESGTASYVKQDDYLATHVSMIKKEDGKIDFSMTNIKVHNLIRGMYPWPVAYTTYEGKMLKIFKSEIDNRIGNIGEVISSNGELVIGCGKNSIKVLELQIEGGKRMSTRDFLLGRKINVGYKF